MAERFLLSAKLTLQPPSNVRGIIQNINSQLRGGLNTTVNVRVNRQGAQRLQRVQKSVQETAKSTKEATTQMFKFGEAAGFAIRRFAAFSVATTAFLRFTRAVRDGISEAISFQRELIKVSQVTGQSVRDIRNISSEISRLATSFGASSRELVQVSRVFSQAGLTANEVRKSLEAVAKSDLAPTFENMNKTAEGSIAIFRQFGITADELEGKLGAINAVAGKFAVESGDIIAAVRRTGGAFQAAGGDLEELIALFTSVRATTRESAESIATGFRTIFTRLQRARTIEFLEQLGINLRDATGQFVGPLAAIRELSTQLNAIRSTDPRFAQITEELGGFRQVSKVIPLVQQFSTTLAALKVAQSGQDSLAKDAVTAQEALEVQIKKLREEFQAFIREVVDSGVFQILAKGALNLAKAFVQIGQALKPIAPLVAGLGAVALGAPVRTFISGAASTLRGRPVQGRGLGSFFGLPFASGGLVPGSGFGDNVPARLTPGEFVIRKQAVQSLGVDNLRRLNRFQGGGEKSVSKFDKKDFESLSASDQEIIIDRYKQSGTRAVKGDSFNLVPGFDSVGTAANVINRRLKTGAQARAALENVILGSVDVPNFAGLFLNTGTKKRQSIFGVNSLLSLRDEDRRNLQNIAQRQGKTLSERASLKTRIDLAGIDPDSAGSLRESFVGGYTEAIRTVVKEFGAGLGSFAPDSGEIKQIAKRTNAEGIAGSIFEGFVQAVARNVPESNDTFDIRNVQSKGPQLAKLFGSIPPSVSLADVKRTISQESLSAVGRGKRASILQKVITEAIQNPSLVKFGSPAAGSESLASVRTGPPLTRALEQTKPGITRATGGSIRGTGNQDTVNALLTPGEFVINKRAAKRIGISRLNRLNRADKFAQGGPVGYQTGGLVSGSTGAILGAGLFAQFLPALFSFNDELEKTTQFIANFGAQAFVLSTILKNLNLAGRFTALANRRVNRGFDTSFLAPGAPFGKNADPRATLSRETFARRRIADLSAFGSEAIRAGQLGLAREAGREITTAEVFIQAERAERQLNEQRQKAARLNNAAALGLSAMVAAAGAASIQLESLADQAFEAGRFALGRRRLQQARATGFGATGGALGGIVGQAGGAFVGARIGGAAGTFGGPVGLLAGALLGAGVGAGIGAFRGGREADVRIQNARLTKSLGDFRSALESVSEGTTDLGSRLVDIRSGIASVNSAFQNISDPETRRSLEGTVNQLLPTFGQIIDKTSQTATSFENLSNVVGSDVISFFTQFSGLSTSEFRAQIEEQIDRRKRAQEAADAESRRDALLNDQLRQQLAFSRSIGTATSQLIRFNTVLQRGAFAGGGAGGPTQVFSTLTDTLQDLNQIGDLETFRRELRAGASQFGDVGRSFASSIEDAATAINILPEILLNLRTADPFGQSAGFRAALDRSLTEAGIGPVLRSVIQEQAGVIIGPASKDANIIKELTQDFTGTLQQFTGAISGTGQSLLDAIQRTNSGLNSFARGLSQATQNVLSITRAQNNLIDTIEQRFITNLSNLPSGRRATTAERNRLRGFDLQRQRNLLGPFSVLAGQPGLLGGALRGSQNRIVGLETQLNNLDERSIDARRNLISQIERERLNAQRLTQALQFLSDATSRAAQNQERLSELQSDRATREGFAARFAFASDEERREINRTIADAIIAVRAGDVNVVPGRRRGDILNLLREFGDVNIPGLGGLTGNQAARGLTDRELRRRGISPLGITRETEEETRLRTAVDQAFRTSIQAQQELIRADAANNQQFILDLNAQINFLINELRRLFIANLQPSTGRARADLAAVQTQRAAALRVQSLGGGASLEAIRNNLAPLLSAEETLRTAPGQLSNLRGFVNQIRTPGLEPALRGVSRQLGFQPQFISGSQGLLSGSAGDEILRRVSARARSLLGEDLGDQFSTNLLRNRGTALVGTTGRFEAGRLESLIINTFTDIETTLQNRLDQSTEESRRRREALGGANVDTLLSNASRIQNLLTNIPADFNFDTAAQEANRLAAELARLNAQAANLRLRGPGFNSGGFVGGTGGVDTIAARLTPGEFVLNKRAVSKVGVSTLNNINRAAGFQNGGVVFGGAEQVGQLDAALSQFSRNTDRLIAAINNFPSEVKLSGNFTVEVVHNGAQIFASLGPSFQKMVETQVLSSINEMLRNKFPEVGELNDFEVPRNKLFAQTG